MTAPIISLAAYRLKQAAIRKGDRVRELVEDFAQVRGVGDVQDDEARALMAAYYCQMGWATGDEIRLALKELEG